jgi:hypothetical protein
MKLTIDSVLHIRNSLKDLLLFMTLNTLLLSLTDSENLFVPANVVLQTTLGATWSPFTLSSVQILLLDGKESLSMLGTYLVRPADLDLLNVLWN